MLFKTRFGEAIIKILARYGNTEAAAVALEILIQTAQADVKQRQTEELAKTTCRGLHMDKPGSGVVCAKCFDAAFTKGATEKAITGDALARGKKEPPAGLAEPGGGLNRDEIADEVTRMLGGAPGPRKE